MEHPRLTNKALGVSGASRNGTRRAITPEHYQQVMEKARTQDAGLAAVLEIARLMGLRSQEAVQSSQSLKTWLKAISRGETRLKVVFGTKGGRPRYTTVLDTGAGIQRKGVTGADGDGSGSWRRSRSLGETGVRLPLEGGMTEFMNVAK